MLLQHAGKAAGLKKELRRAGWIEALDGGFVKDVREQQRKLYRMGVKLEAWINTFTPPLAAGGNLGVSGEVQDGIYSNIHSLSSGCGEALHRMLGFEKEYAVQQSKCSETPC